MGTERPEWRDAVDCTVCQGNRAVCPPVCDSYADPPAAAPEAPLEGDRLAEALQAADDALARMRAEHEAAVEHLRQASIAATDAGPRGTDRLRDALDGFATAVEVALRGQFARWENLRHEDNLRADYAAVLDARSAVIEARALAVADSPQEPDA